MKRSEMLVQMQRAYGIRHVMVETGHLTLEAFMDELLTHMESKGMLPPIYQISIPGRAFWDNKANDFSDPPMSEVEYKPVSGWERE